MEKVEKVFNFIFDDHMATILMTEAVLVLFDGNKFAKLWLMAVAARVGMRIDINYIARRKCEE